MTIKMVIKFNTEIPYSVVIENGAINKVAQVVSALYKKTSKVMIISDSNVFPIYGEKIGKALAKEGFQNFSYVFEAGEERKTMETIMEMYQSLAENDFTRTDLIITLGGGVTGDMGGFAAATYLRGIDYIQVPTSLLAQVDSSVGGKTGLDLPFGKNLVGAFHQPRAVISDPEVLKTLPKHFFVDGMGEVVKCGCIWSEELLSKIETGEALKNLEDTIYQCIECKHQFVEGDTKDKGQRMILNFGHTFAHALEKLHGFKDLSHGRAVAIGMLMITRIGESMNLTEKGTADRLEKLLIELELPTEDVYSIDKIIDATALDKKSFGKTLNLILLKKMGEPFIHPTERNYLVLRCKIMEEKKARNE